MSVLRRSFGTFTTHFRTRFSSTSSHTPAREPRAAPARWSAIAFASSISRARACDRTVRFASRPSPSIHRRWRGIQRLRVRPVNGMRFWSYERATGLGQAQRAQRMMRGHRHGIRARSTSAAIALVQAGRRIATQLGAGRVSAALQVATARQPFDLEHLPSSARRLRELAAAA